MDSFKSFSKAKRSGFSKGKARFTTAKNFAARKPRMASSPEDEVYHDIAYRMCGDFDENVKLAKRFVTLKQQPGCEGMTLPEAIYYLWLQDKQVEFDYQTEIMGGRLRLLGSVPDFLLRHEHILVLVNGTYFHDPRYFPGKRERDEMLVARMMGSEIDGYRVTAVVTLWENDILSCQREFHFSNSLNGVETSSPPWGG